MAQLVRAPARRAGDRGSNPGPGENFFSYDLPDGYSESFIFIRILSCYIKHFNIKNPFFAELNEKYMN